MESWVIRRLELLRSEARSTALGGGAQEGILGQKDPSPGKPRPFIQKAVLSLSQGLLEFHYPVHTVQMGI